MPYNVTIDDLSPLITYKGQWDDSYKSGDPYTNLYLGSSFHATQSDGSQVSWHDPACLKTVVDGVCTGIVQLQRDCGVYLWCQAW